MTKIRFDDAKAWITKSIDEHATDLTRALAERYGVTRAAAATAVKKLEAEGFVRRTGSATRPIFQMGEYRLLMETYKLPGVDESLIWEKDFAPYLDLSPVVANIVHYGFTEMVNNANDHSNGSKLTISVRQYQDYLYIVIEDNGIGIFKKISQALKLADMRMALLELSKGKFTTDPKRHSGEGIFFTSRAFERFSLQANDLEYVHVTRKETEKKIERLDDSKSSAGTSIAMIIRLNHKKALKDVFDQYTTGAPEDFSFNKTVIPVRLAGIGEENLLSRSQAKRLTARIDQFKVVELDFSEVEEIGQAFADELFRVYQNLHPEVKLIPTNVNAYVQRMIMRVLNAK